MQEEQKKRILLLMSPATYRAGAFIQAARQIGVELVVGLDLPDMLAEFWHVPLGLDFGKPAKAVQAIVDFAKEQPLTAILSADDSATELAALACVALGIAANSPRSVEASRDKGLMRLLMSEAGVACPEFRQVSLMADVRQIANEVRYPCVLKPLRLSGSRGVVRVDDSPAFVQAFARLKQFLEQEGYCEQDTSILIEDFIPGFEVALEGLLTNGSLSVLALFDKPDPLDGPYFEETIYVTPSRLHEDVQRAISQCAEQAAMAIGLRDGPLHAELRVNERGPWILEVAGRSIGGLCSTILEFGTGMCLEELILRHILGEDVHNLRRREDAVGVMMIPIPSAGVLKSVSGVEAAKAVAYITGVEITAKLNNLLVPLPEGASYLGFIFARGETPVQVEAALRDAHAQLRFKIRPDLPLLSMGSKR